MPDNAAGNFIDELSNGDKAILGGSIVLLVALFLPWKGVDIAFIGSATEDGFHAWGLLTFIALLGVVALWLMRGPLRDKVTLPEMGLSDARLYMILGGVEVVTVILYWVAFDTESIVGVRFGLFVALVGAVATLVGGYLKESEPVKVSGPGAAPPPPPQSYGAPPPPPQSYGAPPPPAAPPSAAPPSAPPPGEAPPAV